MSFSAFLEQEIWFLVQGFEVRNYGKNYACAVHVISCKINASYFAIIVKQQIVKWWQKTPHNISISYQSIHDWYIISVNSTTKFVATTKRQSFGRLHLCSSTSKASAIRRCKLASHFFTLSIGLTSVTTGLFLCTYNNASPVSLSVAIEVLHANAFE